MILAVRLIVTDSKACASAKAHFPFRCNNLKLIDASSVLAMDEKQSLALSSCEEGRAVKKEDVPPGLDAAPGRRPDGREREPHDRTVRPGIQAFAWHARGTPKQKQGTERLSKIFSYAAGLCLRPGHVRPKSWVQLPGWTQTIAKCLFRRTRVTYDVRAVTATFHHEISRGLSSQRSSKKKAVWTP